MHSFPLLLSGVNSVQPVRHHIISHHISARFSSLYMGCDSHISLNAVVNLLCLTICGNESTYCFIQ